jgi:hypothetical protein
MDLERVEHSYSWVHGSSREQVHLFDGDKQIGTYRYDLKTYHPLNGDQWADASDCPVATVPEQRAQEVQTVEAAPTNNGLPDALDEVNANRARRGLRPFIRDDALTSAAQGAAEYRASHGIVGHTRNDFGFVPSGSSARAAGCGAWPVGSGWGTCCTYENWTYAGASYSIRGNTRYMHLFVR